MKKVRIGGQAVIEGVMMKNGGQYAVAVRKPNQEIEVKVEEYIPVGERYRVLRLPVIRGIFNFIESLVLGVKTLTYSAAFFDEEEAEASDSKKDNLLMIVTVCFSVIFAIALFMLFPAFIAELIGKAVKNHFLLAMIEGVIRLVIFLLYVALISVMKDIRRVFMYHGAEHKSINCLEAGDPLTTENVRKHSRYHKRCGTSFLFVVMIISIIAFMFIDVDTVWLRMLLRVLLVPLIAGISYEFIMFTGRSRSKLAYILSVPGMWIQRMTTREPDEDMIEVAVRSVEAVLDWKAYEEAMHNGTLED